MDSGREVLQAPHDSSRFQRKQHWLANACIWVPSATSPHPRVLHMYTQLESDALPSKAAAPLSPPQRSVSAKKPKRCGHAYRLKKHAQRDSLPNNRASDFRSWEVATEPRPPAILGFFIQHSCEKVFCYKHQVPFFKHR